MHPEDESDDETILQLSDLLAEFPPEMVQRTLEIRLGAAKGRLRFLRWAQANDVLASGIIDLASSTRSWDCHQSSPAVRDQSAPILQIGKRQARFDELLRYEIALNMRSAADQMQGFAALLSAQRSLIGASGISRGIFESCTWAAALMDPSVSQDERLRRLIIRRLVRFMAGVRQAAMLGKWSPQDSTAAAEADETLMDEHGSHLQAEQEIDDLVSLAQALGWKTKKRVRSYDVEGGLSVDRLVTTLAQNIGLEEYAWGSGSSLSHAEHTPLTAGLVAMMQDKLDSSPPIWMMRIHSVGSWAGPRLLLDTFAAYTGNDCLVTEYDEMTKCFWANNRS